MRDYKNIKAYQLAEEFVLCVYKHSKDFPKEEIYGLTSQLRRAAVSVVANIVEGASRQHKKDYLQFLYIARGSLAETECLLLLAFKLDYLSEVNFKIIEEAKQNVARTLYGLIQSVEHEV